MQVSNLVLFSTIEVFIVLLIACVALLIHARKLKGLLKNLQDKLTKLVQDLKDSKAAYKDIQAELNPSNAYEKQLNDQLLLTRQHHLTLGADQDIALDLNVDAPFDRQIAAFRHAILIAEKEALHASGDETPNWNILQSKLTQLIQFYQSSDSASDENDSNNESLEQLQTELDTSKKRIDSLEKFKKLFFDMESQWNDAKDKADDYYQQLSAMAGGVEDKEGFDNVLERYHQVYDQVSDTIHNANSDGKEKVRTNTIEVTKADPRSQDEIRKLRNVAADQHRIIAELEKKLQSASSSEEKEAVIKDLGEQLQRQTRFVQESETCIQLLEEELNSALAQLSEMEKPAADPKTTEQNQKLKGMVQQFSVESKQMLQNISRLEQENEQLADQVSSSSENSGSDEQLQRAQQELLQLQVQYAELEEHYLELKMQK